MTDVGKLKEDLLRKKQQLETAVDRVAGTTGDLINWINSYLQGKTLTPHSQDPPACDFICI